MSTWRSAASTIRAAGAGVPVAAARLVLPTMRLATATNAAISGRMAKPTRVTMPPRSARPGPRFGPEGTPNLGFAAQLIRLGWGRCRGYQVSQLAGHDIREVQNILVLEHFFTGCAAIVHVAHSLDFLGMFHLGIEFRRSDNRG